MSAGRSFGGAGDCRWVDGAPNERFNARQRCRSSAIFASIDPSAILDIIPLIPHGEVAREAEGYCGRGGGSGRGTPRNADTPRLPESGKLHSWKVSAAS